MSWLDTITAIIAEKKSGCCPVCGSRSIDYTATKVTNDDYGYGDIWCNDCHNAYHISRLKITDSTRQGIFIPKDLKY